MKNIKKGIKQKNSKKQVCGRKRRKLGKTEKNMRNHEKNQLVDLLIANFPNIEFKASSVYECACEWQK